jgi:hypothetical protein
MGRPAQGLFGPFRSENVDDLDLVVFGVLHRVSFGFKSSPLLDQRVA